MHARDGGQVKYWSLQFLGIFVDERPINENNSEDLDQDNGGKFSTDKEDKF